MIMILQNPFISRFLDPDALIVNAKMFQEDQRSIPHNTLHDTRDDLFITPAAQDVKKHVEQASCVNVLTSMLNRLPKKGAHANRDKECMIGYLTANKADCPLKLENIDLLKPMIGESPLIYHLIADSKDPNSDWLIPSRNLLDDLSKIGSIDHNSLESVEVCEITINSSTKAELDHFSKWVFSCHCEDQNRFPSGLVSLDVEDIKVFQHQSDELRAAIASFAPDSEKIVAPVPRFSDSNCTSLPAKIMFGNGRTWMGCIRFNYNRAILNGKQHFILDPTPISEDHEAIKILQKLKYYIGENIINDRNNLQDYFKDMYNIDVLLPKAIEMNALCLAAGYRLNRSNMFTHNLIATGGVLNKEASCADGYWCWPVEKLHTALATYLVGDIRFGYTNSIIYLTLMLRNIFPDPYILCYMLELDQYRAVKFFCDLVFTCLCETNVLSVPYSEAETRRDLVRALRGYSDTIKRHMFQVPFEDSIMFSRLIPNWPTVPYGGARFLHQVTSFFVEQYQTLQDIANNHPDLSADHNAKLHKPINDELICWITYNRGVDRPVMLDSCFKPGLRADTMMGKQKIFNINNISWDNESIDKEADRVNRPRVLGMLEQLRISPRIRGSILYNLRELNLDDPKYSFWLTRLTFYDDIKNMISILSNQVPAGVKRLEDEISMKHRRVADQEEETRKKDELIVEKRKKREQLFQIKEKQITPGSRRRTAQQQAVYNLVPGDHTKRNKKNRARKYKKMALIKQLPNFIPNEEFKQLKSQGLTAPRPTFRNYKRVGADLRDVLHEEKQRADVPKTRPSGNDTICAVKSNSIPDLRAKLSTAREKPQHDPQPGPSGNSVKAQSKQPTNNYRDYQEGETSDEDADPYLARYPVHTNSYCFTQRTAVTNADKKNKGKGSGKNTGQRMFKPRPDNFSDSDSDPVYRYF
mgnify:CR=1 FL=1